jgi:hypothetical protein
MHLYMWSDMLMAARLFHPHNIAELAEAMEFDNDNPDDRPPHQDENEAVTERT